MAQQVVPARSVLKVRQALMGLPARPEHRAQQGQRVPQDRQVARAPSS
jgi:hypothetical protein